MMNGYGYGHEFFGGFALFGLVNYVLVLVFLVLGIAALWKYLKKK